MCFVLTHYVRGSVDRPIGVPIAFSKPMLCIFWGAILKMAGYMTVGVPRHMGSARGVPPTPPPVYSII